MSFLCLLNARNLVLPDFVGCNDRMETAMTAIAMDWKTGWKTKGPRAEYPPALRIIMAGVRNKEDADNKARL